MQTAFLEGNVHVDTWNGFANFIVKLLVTMPNIYKGTREHSTTDPMSEKQPLFTREGPHTMASMAASDTDSSNTSSELL
jgi:hypothetical protein